MQIISTIISLFTSLIVLLFTFFWIFLSFLQLVLIKYPQNLAKCFSVIPCKRHYLSLRFIYCIIVEAWRIHVHFYLRQIRVILRFVVFKLSKWIKEGKYE